MINNDVSRDDRMHLSDGDAITNVGFINNDGKRFWPTETKSSLLLKEVVGVKKRKTVCAKIRGIIFPTLVIGILLGLLVMLFIINHASAASEHVEIPYTCDDCSMSLVESIPENLTLDGAVHTSTYKAWSHLISNANRSIQIASMYWALRESDTDPGVHPASQQGAHIFELLKAAILRGVKLEIVQNATEPSVSRDTLELEDIGAKLRYINFTRLLGAGILHTKFILVDDEKFYVGSANMDWRSLTEVKELGIYIHCSCLAADMRKLFSIYWNMSKTDAEIPSSWPVEFDTFYNFSKPLEMISEQNSSANIFLSSSPNKLCTRSRTHDIDAILKVMNDSRKYIDIAVMDYFPTTLYMKDNNIYWPVIDDTLKRLAFERRINVRLLASYWNHTDERMICYLKSLKDFDRRIEVKMFVVPTYHQQEGIPFARVNHNKYMVTDRLAYIGTSNWAGDYFLNTGGVGVTIDQTANLSKENTLRHNLSAVFLRDWYSTYAYPLDNFNLTTIHC